MVTLKDWLQSNGIEASISGTAGELVCDSRQAASGSVFVALPGNRTDGARFIGDAAERGAAIALSEKHVEARIPVIVVPDLRERLPRLAASFYGYPSRSLRVVGVTGTNGKTTTTHLIEGALSAAGHSAGLIGTVSYRYAGKTQPAPNTTPDAVTLQRLMAHMRDAGCTATAMEISSHGLAEHRVDGTEIDVGVFTNLSRDHLDFHDGMEAYFQAKVRLFTEVLPASGKSSRAVINTDDEFGRRLAGMTSIPVWRVGVGADSDFRWAKPAFSPEGFEVEITSPLGKHTLHCRLPGTHNVYNAVQAFAAVTAIGLSPKQALDGLAAIAGVPGRLEHFSAGGVHVYVDYAHSDDALRNVLQALRPLTSGRLITVFGCGGDRDRGKRPVMGQVAAGGSDVVVVTSDNPRTEEPRQILADIEPGVRAAMPPFDGIRGFRIEIDRRSAIQWAIGTARPGDLVLVAGKGHEDYQIVGTVKTHFDDREEVSAALAARGGAK